MNEYPLETEATLSSVPPKRILTERLLRSVEARNSADWAPQNARVQLRSELRSVEARSVTASQYCVISQTISRLPRLSASSLEGSRQCPRDIAKTLKRAARANHVRRMAERLATIKDRNGQRCVSAAEFVRVTSAVRIRRSSVQ